LSGPARQILELCPFPGNQQTWRGIVETRELKLSNGAGELADLRAQLQNSEWSRFVTHA
jgi:hypothetical protein